MLRINQTQLELLLAEMKHQNLDEIEICCSDGYECEYDEAVFFRDKEWLFRWADDDKEYNLLVMKRYGKEIEVSGSCIKEG